MGNVSYERFGNPPVIRSLVSTLVLPLAWGPLLMAAARALYLFRQHGLDPVPAPVHVFSWSRLEEAASSSR